MNFVVVVVYWTSLHDDSLAEAGGNMGKIINCYWAHLVPCFSVWANFAMTDIVLRPKHVIALPIIAGVYGY